MQVEDIRTVMIDGEKWYVGRDVAKALEYVHPSRVVQARVDNEDQKKHKILINNGKYDTTVINKHGLEQFVSSSNRPNAIDIAKKLGINIKVNRKNKKLTKVEDIRTVMIDGKKWFVSNDVGRYLGYVSPSNTVNYHVSDQDKKPYKISINTRRHYIMVINKHGLEQLVSSSTKPNAINIAEKFNMKVNRKVNRQVNRKRNRKRKKAKKPIKAEDIRTVIIDGEKWYVANDVATILGYSRAEGAVYNNVNKENKMRGCVKSGKQNHSMTIINKLGVEELISKSTLPYALDIAKKFGINVNHILNTRKEQDSIHAILKTFKGENMVTQYSVGTYRIDLYFPKYKLAIECDEHGHSDRDQKYEQTRQHYIEDKLGCQFIRYNPDSKDYNIFNVLNRIHKEIYQEFSKRVFTVS